VQQSKSLGHHLVDEKIDAGGIAPGPGKAGNKPKLDWVFADTEDNWNRRGCSFCRERGRRAASRSDHGHPATDQIEHQGQQVVVMALKEDRAFCRRRANARHLFTDGPNLVPIGRRTSKEQ
jgi:hypothetical protein